MMHHSCLIPGCGRRGMGARTKQICFQCAMHYPTASATTECCSCGAPLYAPRPPEYYCSSCTRITTEVIRKDRWCAEPDCGRSQMEVVEFRATRAERDAMRAVFRRWETFDWNDGARNRRRYGLYRKFWLQAKDKDEFQRRDDVHDVDWGEACAEDALETQRDLEKHLQRLIWQDFCLKLVRESAHVYPDGRRDEIARMEAEAVTLAAKERHLRKVVEFDLAEAARFTPYAGPRTLATAGEIVPIPTEEGLAASCPFCGGRSRQDAIEYHLTRCSQSPVARKASA